VALGPPASVSMGLLNPGLVGLAPVRLGPQAVGLGLAILNLVYLGFVGPSPVNLAPGPQVLSSGLVCPGPVSPSPVDQDQRQAEKPAAD